MADHPYAGEFRHEEVKRQCLELMAHAVRRLQYFEFVKQRREWPPTSLEKIDEEIEKARRDILLNNSTLNAVDDAVFPPVVVRLDTESLNSFFGGLPMDIGKAFYSVHEALASDSDDKEFDIDAAVRRSHASALQRHLQGLMDSGADAEQLQTIADLAFSLGRYEERRICRELEGDIVYGRKYRKSQRRNLGQLTPEERELVRNERERLMKTTTKGKKAPDARLISADLFRGEFAGIDRKVKLGASAISKL